MAQRTSFSGFVPRSNEMQFMRRYSPKHLWIPGPKYGLQMSFLWQ